MTATLRTLLASLILGGLAFAWWLPAQELTDVAELHLGKLHADAMSPQRPVGLGLAQFYGGDVLRAPESRHLPLPLFIQSRFPPDVPQLTSTQWQALSPEQAASRQPDSADSPVLRRFWMPPEALPQAAERGVMTVRDADDWRFFSLRLRDADELWGLGIPSAVQFPWRHLPLTLAGVAAAVLLLWVGKPGTLLGTTSVAAARRVALVAIVWLGLMFLYLATDALDGMEVGYAMILVGSVLLLTALVSALWLTLQVRKLARMIAGEGALAQWSLDSEAWHHYLRATRSRALGANLMVLGVVAIIMVLVAAGFWLAAPDRHAVVLTMVILAVVFGAAALAALAMPWLTSRRLRDAPRRVWVGEDGALVGNRYLRWRGLGSRPKGFRMIPVTGTQEMIEVVTQQTQVVPNQQALIFFHRDHSQWIPVPDDRLEEARALLARLRQRFGVE
ncbi:MAG: hypothetical protein ACQEXG_08165 [Pseudomonadota bacterium]